MRKMIFAIAVLFGAGAMTATGSDQAQAVSGANFSKAPGYESSLAQPVAFFVHRKYYKGCYRPYWCKYKHGHHYKGCWYGSCYHKKHHYKKHYYKKHHHYKKHHGHHYYKKKHY